LFYILNVSICGDRPTKRDLIVCDGNSLTEGFGSSSIDNSYPGLLKKGGWNTVNLGVSGQQASTMILNAPEKIDTLWMKGAWVVFWEGINSFVTHENHSPEDGYSLLKTYIKDRKSRGFKTIVVTMIPTGHPTFLSRGIENFRKEYNRLIRDNSASADLIVDLSKDPRLENAMDDMYFNASDRIHLTNEGYQAVYDNFEQAFFK